MRSERVKRLGKRGNFLYSFLMDCSAAQLLSANPVKLSGEGDDNGPAVQAGNSLSFFAIRFHLANSSVRTGR